MASAYPDSKTFRGIKIGDTISNLFSAYDSKYFSVQVGYDDTTATDAQKKLVEMYNAQIEAADPEDIESTISSIDSSAVSVINAAHAAVILNRPKLMTAPLPADFPIRPGFWNVPLWGEIGVYVAAVITIALCAWGVCKNIEVWRRRKDEKLPSDPSRRDRLLKEAVLEEKVRQTSAGRMHAVLVVGFFLLFLGTATATLDWDVGHYVFGKQFLRGNVYLAYKLILDVAGAAVLVALAFAAWRRWGTANELPKDGRFVLAYASLAFIVITGFVIEALRLAVQQPAWMHFSPVGSALAKVFLAMGISTAALETAHIWLWVIHGIAALAFIAAVPLTYYAHIYRVPTAIAVRKPAPNSALPKIENIEEQEHFGISSIKDLSWTDRAQLDACVECGRCNDVCPAVRAGTPLKPRTVVLKLRDRVRAAAAGADDANADDLAGGVVTKDELFSCTTCGACAAVCPADIQTPDFIVGLRRHLALEQGEFPEGAAEALENTASVGNPWGLDPYERMDWAQGLDVPVAEEGEDYDILYWVGCAASYDRRARRIARAMVKILKTAGVKFAVMAEERCHAEFARRLGEEYLYQTAAQENIENFSRFKFKELLTACPHCFNTLKNEYPAFEGGSFAVIDHSSFISRLFAEGKLPRSAMQSERVVWHDPCYLARQNGIVRAPREVLASVGSAEFDPAECGANTLCCGAGGGQMWTDQKTQKKRINVIRLESLQNTASQCGASKIATGCPHCLTMLESAKPMVNGAQELQVLDIAEVVAAKLPDEASPT